MDWITTLGLVAAFLTTVSFLPQTVKTMKSKETKNISLLMYITVSVGIGLWLGYGLILENLPLIMANSLSLLMSVTILGYKLRYK